MQIKTLPFQIWLIPGTANSSLENMTGDVDPPCPEQDPHCLSEVRNGSSSVSLD